MVFSLILNIFEGVSLEKTFHIQITIVPAYTDAKKDHKNLPQT